MSNRVRQMREALGVNHEDFAAQVNVSPRFLVALEEDACVVGIDAAIRIARALGTTVEHSLETRRRTMRLLERRQLRQSLTPNR